MSALRDHILLLRPKDWAKNLFLFIPSFFAGNIQDLSRIGLLALGFVAFSCLASCIYIVNDYRDIEDDRKHPVKHKRPLASGRVHKHTALAIAIVLFLIAIALGYYLDSTLQLLFVMSIYFVVNISYSMGLKNIAILDILLLASGFVIRVKAGAIIALVDTSEWLMIMTYLLALFLAIAKRRDDMLLKLSTGASMRKSMSGYNLDFLNTLLGLFSAIIIVAYIMYTVWDITVIRMGTHRLYYTSVFVMAGLMRYLQITFVVGKSGSPTDILYKDRFIQITLVLWILSFYVILYLRDKTIFG
ncbi:MAG TPA: UbiA prenyltransferase family protein [Chitinophagaceae bacterium]|nr:UbiA prenyltransferase family protein [Chitinophagaceae bacterium]